MITHKTTCRVIYGDTDGMGIAYYANYLRWFEIGRTELFRFLGLTYKTIEERHVFLPVSEIYCKFLSSLGYDDIMVIETSLDTDFKAGMKFDYNLFDADETNTIAEGYTKHAFLNEHGKVIRPPDFITAIIAQHL